MRPETFERIRTLLKARAAIVLEPSQEYLVESRIEPIAKARGFKSVDDLCRHPCSASPEVIGELVEAMMTHETSFFRDVVPFDVLRDEVLPQLIAKRAATRTLRIWSAAASSGQEPYSIALAIREHFPVLRSWVVQIIATDLARGVLDKARAGRYCQVEVERGVSADYLAKYFQKVDDAYELDPSVRRMVRFQELNLVQTWPHLPVFDLIFMRNVLIYFDLQAKRTILQQARRQLAPDGYLFLGGSEVMPGEHLGFERLQIPRSGCYRARAATRRERRSVPR